MRKLILASITAFVAVPTCLSAQTHEISKDERTVETRHQALQDAVQGGDPRTIENSARGERKAREELREDRDHFARHHYVAPYSNWSYSAVTPGTTLRSRFYGTHYYVADPASYDLRAAKHNQRWVRYGDDLVLVNVRTGRVMEVATDRF
jgi:Ni/Co efflux regulator RcnB